MSDESSASRRSYTVVFEANVGDFTYFLQRLRKAIERTHSCTEAEDWKGVGATMQITVAETEVEVIACPLNEVSFGSIMLNIAEPFSFLKLLQKRDFNSVRSAAVEVSNGLIDCGIAAENQFWARSNPPDFENVEDWVIGKFTLEGH